MNQTNSHPNPPVVPLAQNVNVPRIQLDPRPYPEVRRATPAEGGAEMDASDVIRLQQDYAGRGGELSAITLYIFQNTTTDDVAFANALLQIAITEMTHLDMLGDAIRTLGGTAEFKSSPDGYWSAANINYATDREGMLRAAIAAETGAISAYNAHAAATRNPTVRDFLLRIADDEKLHLVFFQEELARTSL